MEDFKALVFYYSEMIKDSHEFIKAFTFYFTHIPEEVNI